MIARVVTVPENHVGINPWWLVAGAGPAILASVLLPTGWRVAAVAIGLVNVLVVAAAIHFNFLLQYTKIGFNAECQTSPAYWADKRHRVQDKFKTHALAPIGHFRPRLPAELPNMRCGSSQSE